MLAGSLPAVWALLGVAILPALAGAQVYRWVDDQGVTHYGEKPGTRSAREVPRQDATDAPAPGRSAGQARAGAKGPDAEKAEWARKEREFQKRRQARMREEKMEKRAQETQARQAASDERRKRSECALAQRDLASMRNNPTNYSFDQEKRVKERLASNCN